jgi:Amt family ammonium transporter
VGGGVGEAQVGQAPQRLAGVLVVVAAVFIDSKLRIDDPVGASAVHGVNGAWGILSLGLLANGTYGQGLNGVPYGVTGLLYGDKGQFLASLIGIGANVVYVGGMAALAFWVIGKVVGNRVSAEDEIAGLDLPEMGVHALGVGGARAARVAVEFSRGSQGGTPSASVQCSRRLLQQGRRDRRSGGLRGATPSRALASRP